MENLQQDFGVVGNEFINIYTDDNGLLETGDMCYFMFSSVNAQHRPLLASGIIIHDNFNVGLNKQYTIQLHTIHESPSVIAHFCIGQTFNLIKFDKNTNIGAKKLVQISNMVTFSDYCFKVDAFFVRDTLKKISTHRIDYIKVLKTEVERQLIDIQSVIDQI